MSLLMGHRTISVVSAVASVWQFRYPEVSKYTQIFLFLLCFQLMSTKLTADVLPSVQELALWFYTRECHPVSLSSPSGHLFVRYPDPPLWNSAFFLVSSCIRAFLRSQSLTVALMKIHSQIVSFTLMLSFLIQLSASSSSLSSFSSLLIHVLVYSFPCVSSYSVASC